MVTNHMKQGKMLQNFYDAEIEFTDELKRQSIKEIRQGLLQRIKIMRQDLNRYLKIRFFDR